MYNKLFTKILDSSIWLAPDPHRLVWITLIASMDRYGVTQFACAQNLADRSRVSLKATKDAITAFESPDKHDPEQEFEGRRIERIPGGWLVLNAEKYRDMVTAAVASEKTRERMRKYRERKRVTLGDGALRSVTPSEAEAVSEAKTKKLDRAATQPDIEGFQDFQAIFPKRAGSHRWPDAQKHWKARLREGYTAVDMTEGARRYQAFIKATGKERTEFVSQAASFLGTAKLFLEPWDLPPSKAQVQQDANIDAAKEWLNGS